MINNTENVNSTDDMSFSTDDIYRGNDTNRCLSDDLNTIESNITTLQTGKAPTNHTHSNYMTESDAAEVFAPINHTHASYLSESDAVESFAAIDHTHTGYAATTHTHPDLEGLIDDLDTDKADANHTHAGYATVDHTHTEYAPVAHTHSEYMNTTEAGNTFAPVAHTHAQSEITGLTDKLSEIDTAIASLQAGDSGSNVEPMLIASMHLGKLDNNSGAEFTSTTRICSDAFAIQNGKSYWQVNNKAVAMYVLIYDADEVFLSYLGSFDSGVEIAINNADAAYMRIGSKLGEYDLTNEFRIYDVNPASGESSTSVNAYTKAEADARFAPISHAHSEYATSDHTHAELHTHSNKDVLDGITAAKVAAWDSGTGSTTTIDAYTKTESDAKYALVGHTHSSYMTEDDAVTAFAPKSHTHANYMTEADAEDSFAPITHTHSEYMTETAAGNAFAPVTHTHAGYAASNHTHSYNDLTDVPSATTTYVHPDTHPASMITGLATVATSGKYSDLTDKPVSLPANGGDADSVGGRYPASFANVDHAHSNYLPLAGGTLTGNLNVGGIFRVANQQAVYNGGDMMTLATNNLPTMIAGSKIYSKQTITVSSDERLKENIEYVDPDDCLDFINDVEVKTFNYIGDDTPCIGVIAQDIQDNKFAKFFVCKQPGEEGYLAVKAADLVFPLIAAVQNLSAEIDYLKAKI